MSTKIFFNLKVYKSSELWQKATKPKISFIILFIFIDIPQG